MSRCTLLRVAALAVLTACGEDPSVAPPADRAAPPLVAPRLVAPPPEPEAPETAAVVRGGEPDAPDA